MVGCPTVIFFMYGICSVTFPLIPLGPSWLKNLYFAYLLVLRALTKMESYWTVHQFYTGNSTEDAAVNNNVFHIIQAAK